MLRVGRAAIPRVACHPFGVAEMISYPFDAVGMDSFSFGTSYPIDAADDLLTFWRCL